MIELRHLRYFVAVAEEGSVTLAADRRLHTAQPSLSRQLRDLEQAVGVQLFTRNSRGVELTPAGRAFLDHARLALSQVEAAGEAARRAAYPAKASFVMGFLTGQEMEWLPHAMRILHEAMPATDIVVSSQTSPELANGLMKGRIDVAFMRAEKQVPDLEFKLLVKEPLVVVLPSDHRLASRKSMRLTDLVGETFISVSKTAPALRGVLDAYIQRSGLDITPDHEADNLSSAISLVASTRGVALLPLYALNFLPWSVITRPIDGEAPAIDLMLGYHKANSLPLLKLFVSRTDALIAAHRTRNGR